MKQKLRYLYAHIKSNFRKRELAKTIKLSDKQPIISTTKEFNVAVIGAGAMGRDQCLGLEAIPQAKVVAIADNNEKALDRLRQQVHLPDTRFYSDAQELFEKEQLDLACIATNTTSHLLIAEMAVAAEVPRIIVEKPIGNNVTAARRFVRHCQEKNIKLSVNQSRRWSDTYSAISRCINQGFIGKIRHIHIVIGPGGFAMVGSHFIDLSAYLGNSTITWIIGFLESEKKPNKRGAQFNDPSGYALFGLDNGIRAYLDLSQDLVRRSMYITLFGESGRIEIDERAGVWHLANDVLSRRTFRFTGPTKPVGYFTKVAAEMLSDAPPSCSAEEAINTLEAVIAVHVSNTANHERISIPLQGDDAEVEFSFP